MAATHYHGSKGPVEIATTNPHHLASAHAKLIRERTNDARDAEIEAMGTRLAELAEEYAAQQVSQ